MRSKISDQDLTDYALDELGSDERLYVESMLAVSEECRNDVYEMIDTAMMLEEVFEREEGKQPLGLTADQRMALLDVRVKNHFVRRTAVVLAAAAAVALAFVSKDQWMPKGPTTDKMVEATNHMGSMVVQAVTGAEGEDFVSQLALFRSKLTEDSAKWLPSQAPAGATVFGPPSPFSIEAPHAALDLKP